MTSPPKHCPSTAALEFSRLKGPQDLARIFPSNFAIRGRKEGRKGGREEGKKGREERGGKGGEGGREGRKGGREGGRKEGRINMFLSS